MSVIRVLLVDDHAIVMDGIASLLAGVPHMQVVGKAASVSAAKSLITQLLPDLVLTDITLGDASGLDLTKYITQQFPLIRVIALTMHDSVQHISSLLDAGALGYLLKNVRQDELLIAINQVCQGHQYIQHSIASHYTRTLLAREEAARKSLLSPREIEIIKLIAQELTTAEISRQLFLSEHTIDTHRKNILRKTGVKGSIGLINYARQSGLLD